MGERRLLQSAAAAALLAFLGLLVWAAASPEGFLGFLWRHFAGPIAAQAEGHPVTWRGIEADQGYSLPSLLGYGAVLGLGVYALDALLLRRLEVRLDWGFAAALAPFFVFGPLVRALQVTGYFSGLDGAPVGLAYAVVEPVVYITTAFLAALALAWGATVSRLRIPLGMMLAVEAGGLIAAALLVRGLLGGFGVAWLVPWWGPFAAIAVGLGASVVARIGLRRHAAGASLGMGLVLVAPFVYATAAWMMNPDVRPWTGPAARAGEAHGWIMPVVFLLAVTLAVLATALARAASGRFPRVADLARPEAALLVFAHAVDGFSTIIGVKDPFGWGLPAYREQNPVSLALLEVGAGWGFLVAKLVVALAAAWVLSDFARETRKDGASTPWGALVPLGFIVVFALGWGPGFTNLLRAAFGV